MVKVIQNICDEYRISIMALLLISACLLTYCFHDVLKTAMELLINKVMGIAMAEKTILEKSRRLPKKEGM